MSHNTHQFVPSNAFISAAPSKLMSLRINTFLIVMKITWMSVQSVQWSTYHTSSLNFSVQLMATKIKNQPISNKAMPKFRMSKCA